jgi:hypothetical protein
MTAPGQGRIALLDTFRFTAVTLALLQHVSSRHGLDGMSGGADQVWKLITRGATPSLLIIFGMMLEIAYARKFASGPGLTIQRMLYRAVLCYAAFVISSFVATSSGKDNLISLVGSFFLLAQVPYAGILVTYVFLLVIGIGVIALRLRSGFPALLAVVGLIWLFDALYLEGTSLWPFPFAQLGGALLGWGDAYGPSVLHGLTLVVFGMALAAAIFSHQPSRGAGAVVAIMLVGAAGLVLEAVRTDGLYRLAIGIADFAAYRAGNDPIYYAYGICASMVYLALAILLHSAMPLRARRLISTLGCQTLAYYVVGNAVLLLLPDFPVTSSAGIALLSAIMLPTFWVCTLLWLGWARSSPGLARADRWVRVGLEALVPRSRNRQAVVRVP